MKGKLYIGIKVLIFVILLAAILKKCEDVLSIKDEKSRISSFYEEEEDSLGAVFIGSSHMFVTVYPFQLWEEYGIQSTVLGGNGMGIPMEYYCVKEAIRKQQPDVIVVDLYKAYLDKKLEHISFTHNMADALPFGRNKMQMLFDLIPKENRVEFCFPLYLYHSRWKELTQTDFEKTPCYTKGAAPQFRVYDASGFQEISQDEKQEVPEIAMTYINKIIKECKENNVELIFTVMPYETNRKTEYQQRVFNELADYLADENIDYYNFFHLMDKTGLNTETDFYDEAHVNYNGGKKITSYLGKILSDRGLGTTHRNENKWNEETKLWHAQVRNKQIKTIDNKREYLDFIGHEDYEFVLMIKNAEKFTDYFDEEISWNCAYMPEGKCIYVYDDGNWKAYSAEKETVGIEFNGKWIQNVKEGKKMMMLGKEKFQFTEDVNIFVYDKRLHQIVDIVGIKYDDEQLVR